MMLRQEKWMPACSVLVLHVLLIGALVATVRSGPISHPSPVTQISLLPLEPEPNRVSVAVPALPMREPVLRAVALLPVPDVPTSAARPMASDTPSAPAYSPSAAHESLPPAATADASFAMDDSDPHMDDASAAGNPKPVYPAASRKLGESGTVMINVYVLPDGSVGELRLAKTSGYARLDAAAMDAVRKWRFIPARRAGQPIAMWYAQSVRFSLS